VKRPEGVDRTPPPAPPPPSQKRQKPHKPQQPHTAPKRLTTDTSSQPQKIQQSQKLEQSRPARAKPEAHSPGGASRRRSERVAARIRRRAERGEVRRFTRQSRRRRLTATLLVVGVLSLIGGVATVALSPLMALSSIQVLGTERLEASEVAAALDEHRGTPLAVISDADVRADLEQFALIRSFSTEIVPPDTLIVRIVERAPLGVVPRGSAFDIVDAAGVVLESVSERPAGVARIDVETVAPDDPAFRSVAEVLVALPSRLRQAVSAISATTRDDVRFTLDVGNHAVVWGSAERSEYKARVLSAALAATDQSVRWEYDVSAPDSLVVRRAD